MVLIWIEAFAPVHNRGVKFVIVCRLIFQSVIQFVAEKIRKGVVLLRDQFRFKFRYPGDVVRA